MHTYTYDPNTEYALDNDITQINGITTYHAEIINLGDNEIIASTIGDPFLGNKTTRTIAPHGKACFAVNVYTNSIYVKGSSTVKLRGINLDAMVSEQRLMEEVGELLSYTESLMSLPNILSNPDFSVNQRGQQEYTSGYCADCWKIITANTKVTMLPVGVKVGFNLDTPSVAVIGQAIEDYSSLAGKKVTASVFIAEKNSEKTMLSVNYLLNGTRQFNTKPISNGINTFSITVPAAIEDLQIWIYGGDTRTGFDTSDSYTIVEWAKLEVSDKATRYIQPGYADNLHSCQRYFQLRSTGDVNEADLRPLMAKSPQITQRSDGLYEYSADIL